MGEDWHARSLTRISSGAPPLAVSGPVSHVAADGTHKHVFYFAASGQIIELWWPGNATPQAENLTLQAHAPLAPVNDERFNMLLASHYVQSEDTQHVFFADAELGTPWEIWWRGSEPKTPENLTKRAGAPAAYSSDPFHSLVTADGNQHVIILTNEGSSVHRSRRPPVTWLAQREQQAVIWTGRSPGPRRVDHVESFD